MFFKGLQKYARNLLNQNPPLLYSATLHKGEGDLNNNVVKLDIYPIKSLAGIRFESAKAEKMGFENDRRWMLIDEENQFITQRKHSILSQFYPEINGEA